MSIAAIGAIWLRLFLYPKSNEKSKIFPVGQASQSDIGCHLHKQWRVHKLCKHPAQMKMKASTIFCALLAIVVGAQLISAHIENKATISKPETEETYLEEMSLCRVCSSAPSMFWRSMSVTAYIASVTMMPMQTCLTLKLSWTP